MTPPADLLADLAAASARGGGRYRAEIGAAWSFSKPSGGVLTSLALAAMARELGDPTLRPLSATAVFAVAIEEGAVDVAVTILRRGRAAAQLRAVLLAPGAAAGLEVVATFARALEGPRFVGVAPPDVPPPDRAEDLDAAHARWRFFHQLDTRLGAGARFWEPGFAAGPPRLSRWFRYRAAPLTAGVLDPLALPPLADTMPVAIAAHLGGDRARFYAPSLDLTVHFLGVPSGEWILLDSFARAVADGFASAQAELWDEAGNLVAYATQTMIIKPAARPGG